MADYYAVLKRAIAALPEPTGEARRAVYEKARTALVNQLKSFDPPLPAADITRQRLALEDHIRKVESEAARGVLAQRNEAIQAARLQATPTPVTPPPTPQPVPVPTPSVAAPATPVAESTAATQVLRDTMRQAQSLGGAAHESARAAREALGIEAPPEPRREPSLSAPVTKTIEPVTIPDSVVVPAPAPAIVAEPAFAPLEKREVNRRNALLITAVVVLAVIAAGIGVYTQRESLRDVLAGTGNGPVEAARPSASTTLTPKNTDRLLTEDGQPAPAAPTPTPAPSNQSMAPAPAATPAQPAVRTVQVQTINPTAPAAEPPAPATPGPLALAPTAPAPATPTPAPAPATPAPAATTPAPAAPGPLVAQRATLYEESLIGSNQGSVVGGQVVWRTVREVNASGVTQTMLKARSEIPERNIVVNITIRPNADQALPASHMVEVRFEVGPNFPGRAVRTVPGLIMKPSEAGRGDALTGAAVAIGNGLFWIALAAPEADRNRNLLLLRERGWIDLPLVYETGRRAILTIEKGTVGDRAVEEALTAWAQGG